MKAKRKERVAGVSVKRMAPLTKAEMIANVQRREAALWLTLKETEECWGSDDDITIIARARWSAVHDMMNALGIPQDFGLSDMQAATDIIIRRIRS